MTDELWFGVLAPAGTPRPIVDRIAAAVRPFTISPEVEENPKAYGEFPHYIGPEELKARMVQDWGYFGGLIERHHMRIIKATVQAWRTSFRSCRTSEVE